MRSSSRKKRNGYSETTSRKAYTVRTETLCLKVERPCSSSFRVAPREKGRTSHNEITITGTETADTGIVTTMATPTEEMDKTSQTREVRPLLPLTTVPPEDLGIQNPCPRPCLSENLKNVIRDLPKGFPVGGKLPHFLENWKAITKDRFILDIIENGLNIPLMSPYTGNTEEPVLDLAEGEKIEAEIAKMLEKRAIREVIGTEKKDQGRVFSSLFARKKPDGSLRPIVNLRKINRHIPYHHFKMEGIHSLRGLLTPNDYLIKIDMKDAFFSVPLNAKSKKLVSFRWGNKAYEFQVMCFGLACAPHTFTKLTKAPISILRRVGVRLVIYLDDILLMAQTLEEIQRARDLTLFLLENLGFTINLQKSILTPQRSMVFLGLIIDTPSLTILLPEEKVTDLVQRCNGTIGIKSLSALNVAKLVGKLIATRLAVSPALMHVRQLQMCLRKSLQKSSSYESVLTLSTKAKQELCWWARNLSLRQGRPLNILPPDMIIQSDAATSGGWGAACQGTSTGGKWTKEEAQLHINEQELLAATLAVKTFTKWKEARSIHLQIDNMVALSYIVRQGGTKSQRLVDRARELWDYLASKGIMITAEWLPTHLNTVADYESRNVEDSSDWLLNRQVFKSLCKAFKVNPSVDLFASRTCHQLKKYMAYKMDPEAVAVDAIQQDWGNFNAPYAFPPFALIGQVLQKIESLSETVVILVAPVWPTSPWYPALLDLTVDNPVLLPTKRDLLSNPSGNCHPLLGRTPGLKLAGWKLSSSNSDRREYRRRLANSSLTVEGSVQQTITMSPGLSLQAGVSKGASIPFTVL